MSLVRNKAGLQTVEISNFQEISDLSARAVISDGTSSVFLNADNNGRLNVNVSPADTLNSHITDDPANSVAVGLTGRQTIETATTQTHLKCDANGQLFVDNPSFGHLNNISTNQTNGNQQSKVMGSQDGTTGGTQKQIRLNTDGRIETMLMGSNDASGGAPTRNVAVDSNGRMKVVTHYGATISNQQTNGNQQVKPANSVNSHITDDPANSVAVGLKGRTTIGTATTETFLKTDAQGHLQVDINELKSQTKTINQYASQSLAGSSAWAVEVDTTGYGHISFSINSNASTNLFVYGSATSGGTFLPFKEIFINSSDTGVGTHNVGFVEIHSPPDFLKIFNVDAGGVVLEIITTMSN